MGQSQSAILQHKLSHALPDYSHSSWCEDKKARPYTSEKDRDQFIYGVTVVLSNNGQIDLQNHNFALVYSRRPNDRLVARIVAEKNGVITAKIDGVGDGKDQNDAFKLLRKRVETLLDKLLDDVPNPSGVAVEQSASPAGPSSPIQHSMPAPVIRNIPIDAPPAYGTGDIKPKKG